MKLETIKDTWDTTPHAKFGWRGWRKGGLRWECIFGDCVLSIFTRESSYCFQRVL